MKRLFFVVSTLATVGLCGLVGARYLLGVGARSVERRLTRLAAQHGLEISKSVSRTSGFRWPASYRWEGLSLQGRLAVPNTPLPHGDLSLSVESVTATVEHFGTRLISVFAEGLLITAHGNPQPADSSPVPRVERVTGRALVVRAPIDFLQPRTAAAQLRSIADELRKLAGSGRCSLPVTFEGTVTFPFRGTATVGIRVRPKGGETVLTMDESDLLALSVRLGLKLPLTRDEATLLARHPLQVPRLLAIRDEARELAEAELRRDRRFPADAYRHLLWSYLLTTDFGERFASEVTDAHERGITGNTEAERLMDLSNNALGRWYAKLGVPAASLLDRVRNDSRVIRNPQEIARKKPFTEG